MAEDIGFEPINLFLDQTVFEAVLLTHTVDLPNKKLEEDKGLEPSPAHHRWRQISNLFVHLAHYLPNLAEG